MTAEYSGLPGGNIAAGRVTTVADPASATLNAAFEVSNATRLGTGRFSVKLQYPDSAATRVVVTSSNDGNFANEDFNAPSDGSTLVIQITNNAGQPAEGVAQFVVVRTKSSA